MRESIFLYTYYGYILQLYHTFKIENGCVIFYAKNDDNVETHTVYYRWIFDWFFTGFYWFFTLVNKLVSIQVFWVGVTRFLNLGQKLTGTSEFDRNFGTY